MGSVGWHAARTPHAGMTDQPNTDPNRPTELTTRRADLLAAWPGMGNVAAIAAGYLVRKLDLEPMGVMPLIDTFDLNFVGVRSGVVERPHLPRGLLFRTPSDRPGRPLIVFLAEAQPTRQGYAFVHNLLDQLADEQVERVYTFASLASAIHPSENPKVTAAATTKTVLNELADHGVEPTPDGRIGGLNGLMLGAAAERELDGACLLAQIPFFAARVPNFRAARSLLSAFCDITGRHVDFQELNERVELTEDDMLRLMERFERAREAGEAAMPFEADEDFEGMAGSDEDSERQQREAEPELDPQTESLIEDLFEHAAQDREAADALKDELDRLGVFEKYEDRFLDLFKSEDN